MKTLTLVCMLSFASAATAGEVAGPCKAPVSAAATEPVAPACEPAPPGPAYEAPIAHITAADLQNAVHHADDELVILDVRTPEEFAAGHIPEARNIPHDQVADRLVELAPLHEKTVVLYCRSGRRSGIAAKVLRDAGFYDVRLLEGDFPGWEKAMYPVERASAPAAPVSN